MHLMVCADGCEVATVPLRDGDDPFNREAERGALDRAYEALESNPDSLVTIVVVGDPEGEREYMDARFDVTGLTREQRGQLERLIVLRHGWRLASTGGPTDG